MWRNAHLIVGVLGLVIFALQGQYMGHVIEVMNQPDTQRMFYRSAHIYFMTACGMNMCIGHYLSEQHPISWPHRLASLLILLAPAPLLISFFVELNTETLDRPMITLGLYALFGGAAILGTLSIVERIRGKSSRAE